MAQSSERGQVNRWIIKRLAQGSIRRAKEGLGCSQFKVEALANIALACQAIVRSPSKCTLVSSPFPSAPI
jgi:hypothetical protein